MNNKLKLERIKEYLNENEIELDIDLQDEGLELISSIINYSSDIIDMDIVTSDTDIWGQITTYIKQDGMKGYTVIIEHSFEKIIINDIEELADIIIEYENEAKELIVSKGISDSDKDSIIDYIDTLNEIYEDNQYDIEDYEDDDEDEGTMTAEDKYEYDKNQRDFEYNRIIKIINNL